MPSTRKAKPEDREGELPLPRYELYFFYDELRSFVTMYFRVFTRVLNDSDFTEVVQLQEVERIMDRINQDTAYKSKVEFDSDRYSVDYNSSLGSKVFKINNCTFQ